MNRPTSIGRNSCRHWFLEQTYFDQVTDDEQFEALLHLTSKFVNTGQQKRRN